MSTVIGVYTWVFDDVEFGIAMKEWREAHGMDQKAIGDILGYTSSHVSAIERGRLSNGFPMRGFMEACALMDADPRRFFSVQHV